MRRLEHFRVADELPLAVRRYDDDLFLDLNVLLHVDRIVLLDDVFPLKLLSRLAVLLLNIRPSALEFLFWVFVCIVLRRQFEGRRRNIFCKAGLPGRNRRNPQAHRVCAAR